MKAAEMLARYVDHAAEPGLVDAVARAEGAEAAVQAAVRVVRDATAGAAGAGSLHAALAWLRDAAAGVGSSTTRAEVRASLPEVFTPVLAEGLVAPVYEVRRQLLAVCGKIGLPEHLPQLLSVASRYLDGDPLLVPALVDEVAALRGEAIPLLDGIRKHPHYLTRWSFFGTLDTRLRPDAEAERTAMCALLTRDPTAVVRAEARYMVEELDMLSALDRVTTAHVDDERRRWQLTHRKTMPLRFTTLADRFLARHTEPDYDVATLDAFVRATTAV